MKITYTKRTHAEVTVKAYTDPNSFPLTQLGAIIPVNPAPASGNPDWNKVLLPGAGGQEFTAARSNDYTSYIAGYTDGTQEISGTVRLAITGFSWSGHPDVIFYVMRQSSWDYVLWQIPPSSPGPSTDSEVIATLPCEASNTITMASQPFLEPIKSDENIVIVAANRGTGAKIDYSTDHPSVQGQIQISMKKVSGFVSRIENTRFGSYDDPNVVGS